MQKVDLFTDGACRGNPGPGGYGVVLEYLDNSGEKYRKELSEGYINTTNNRMELMAVLKGLGAFSKPCEIKIYTDSQYIVNAFNQGWLNSWILNNWKRGKKKEPVKNEDLWKQIIEKLNGHKVEWIWVKGHNGHPQNERCDVLATIAADGENLIDDIGFEA
ncbi:MAG: ribonuclease HI [Firmicutes bacterium HGW-Firmicutes-1]|jgi:ribonuclease HI|nr:MAG: ribonuclease HI [Firmicutes bacterium HGW-Firmicutes-1]